MTSLVCWQYQVKTEQAKNNQYILPIFDPKNFKIHSVPYNVARDFIAQYEWLGNMGTSKYCFGLSFNNFLASVVCYGPPVVPNHYSKLLCLSNSGEILQLCRGASTYWAPTFAASKLICASLKMIYRSFGVRAVVAYADPEAGEIGTVYQASNAYYLGMTSPGGGKRYIIHGHSYDPRKVHKKFGSRSHSHLIKIDPNFSTFKIKPKHRYLFLLGNDSETKIIKDRVRHLLTSYPKRISTIVNPVAANY